jgi:hypothetical protein
MLKSPFPLLPEFAMVVIVRIDVFGEDCLPIHAVFISSLAASMHTEIGRAAMHAAKRLLSAFDVPSLGTSRFRFPLAPAAVEINGA